MGRSSNEFQCLGSVIAESGCIDVEVDRRIENALKAFGARKGRLCAYHQYQEDALTCMCTCQSSFMALNAEYH